MIFLNQHLLVQSQQWKHRNDMQNLLKVNCKDPGVLTANFEQILDVVLVFLLLTLNK